MFSAPLIWPRAMSGTQMRASGSSGVPGTVRTRGSRCAWLHSTASRWRVAHPVMPGPDYHRSPNRSQFRCTFETPGSGPQRTDEASVRGHVRESLVRVNTNPMLRLAGGGNADGMPDPAADLVPPQLSLPKLREAAAGCRACPLWEDATQTVFGAGSRNSVAMFVGEQPGDREDREGAPFIGPAGRLLDDALVQAGIDRRAV